MKSKENRDMIIDDIILDSLYKRKGRFTIEEVEEKIYARFKENNIDPNVYGMLIPNALLRLLVGGRFRIERKYFIYEGDNVLIEDKYHDELVEIKNKIEKKQLEKENFKKLKKSL